ncbi:MAG TPA: hypothetical protein VFJ97_06565 [Dermatophilaceae bacterium]|nr:hypothetical protein [Dermatophilaceae bacterium]
MTDQPAPATEPLTDQQQDVLDDAAMGEQPNPFDGGGLTGDIDDDTA